MLVRKYTRREHKLIKKPWIIKGIVSSIKHKECLLRIYKRSKLLADFERYKIQKPSYACQRTSKRKYYEDQFAEFSRNSKRI